MDDEMTDKAKLANALGLVAWSKQPWLIEGQLVVLPVVPLGPELAKYLEQAAATTSQTGRRHQDDQTLDEVEGR